MPASATQSMRPNSRPARPPVPPRVRAPAARRRARPAAAAPGRDRRLGRAWRWLAPLVNPKRHERALDNLTIAFPEKSRRAAPIAHGALGEPRAGHGRDDAARPADRGPGRGSASRRRQLFSRYKDKLGAAIGVSLHMGNWELAIWPLTVAGANPAAVYRSVNNPYVDQYLRGQRQRPVSRRPVRARQGRGRARRRPADGARHPGLRAPRRPARPGLRSLRPHRAAGAVLRQGRADPGDRRHDRPPRRRPHLDVALQAGRHARAASKSRSRSCACRARRTSPKTCAGS